MVELINYYETLWLLFRFTFYIHHFAAFDYYFWPHTKLKMCSSCSATGFIAIFFVPRWKHVYKRMLLPLILYQLILTTIKSIFPTLLCFVSIIVFSRLNTCVRNNCMLHVLGHLLCWSLHNWNLERIHLKELLIFIDIVKSLDTIVRSFKFENIVSTLNEV